MFSSRRLLSVYSQPCMLLLNSHLWRNLVCVDAMILKSAYCYFFSLSEQNCLENFPRTWPLVSFSASCQQKPDQPQKFECFMAKKSKTPTSPRVRGHWIELWMHAIPYTSGYCGSQTYYLWLLSQSA